MVMSNKELTCVDKLGCSLAGGIQVVRSCTIPGRSRATVHCKVNDGYFSGLGVVESMHGIIRPAHSLNQLTERGEIWVHQHQPLPRVGKPTVWLHTGPILSYPGGGQRAVVGNHDGESLTALICRAEGYPTPRWDA